MSTYKVKINNPKVFNYNNICMWKINKILEKNKSILIKDCEIYYSTLCFELNKCDNLVFENLYPAYGYAIKIKALGTSKYETIEIPQGI